MEVVVDLRDAFAVGHDGGVVEQGLLRGHGGFGFEDFAFHRVPLALLVIGEFLFGLVLDGSGFDGRKAVELLFRLRGLSLFPLRVVGVDAGGALAVAIEAEDLRRDAIEHVAVVGNEDEGAAEIEEILFEGLERGDIEVVGGFVQKEEVGFLEHEAGDLDAGAFAAGEFGDGLFELIEAEAEAFGPGGDVNGAVLVEDGIAVGTEGELQGEGGVDFLGAILSEVNGLEEFGAGEGALIGVEVAAKDAEERGFARAVGADEAEAETGGEGKGEITNEGPAAEGNGEGFGLDELFGLASGSGEVDADGGGALAGGDVGELIDQGVRGVDAGFRFSGAGFGTAAEPFDFAPDFVGERFAEIFLGDGVFFLAFEEFGVVAFDEEESVGVGGGHFGDVGGGVLEEVAVVSDDDGGEAGLGEELFEPLNAGKVEVVGGFVEEDGVGFGNESFEDGEALAPTAGEGGGELIEVFKAGLAQESVAAGSGFVAGNFAFEDLADGESLGEDGFLSDVCEAGELAESDFAGVRVDASGEDLEEGGFAGAVGTDEAEAIAIVQGERDIGKEGLGAKAFLERETAQQDGHELSSLAVRTFRLDLRSNDRGRAPGVQPA